MDLSFISEGLLILGALGVPQRLGESSERCKPLLFLESDVIDHDGTFIHCALVAVDTDGYGRQLLEDVPL